MHIVVDDDATLDKVDRAYFRKLLEAGHTSLVALARASGLSISAVNSRFDRWGWKWILDTPEPDEAAAPTRLAGPEPAPATATPIPPPPAPNLSPSAKPRTAREKIDAETQELLKNHRARRQN
jgi:hypothetical protein